MAFSYDENHRTRSLENPDLSICRTYLCTEPFGKPPLETDFGSVNLGRLLETLQMSADYFAKQDKSRTAERLKLEVVKLYMKAGEWKSALRTLLIVWQQLSWRRQGWWELLAEANWALEDCVYGAGDMETLVAVRWELLCSCR